MKEIRRFQELLSHILKIAQENKNHIHIDTVQNLLKEMELQEDQLEQIYSYLSMNKIAIDGYKILVNPKNNFNSEIDKKIKYKDDKEQDYTVFENKKDALFEKTYLEDLEGISSGTIEEEEELLIRLKNGDENSKQRIIEIYLPKVLKIAKEYKNKGVLLEDLVQEGNMGLMSSIESIGNIESTSHARDFIKKEICRWIEDATKEQEESIQFEQNVINKINYIYETIGELEKDLGREVTLEELSFYTKLPKEELEEILDLSLEELIKKI